MSSLQILQMVVLQLILIHLEDGITENDCFEIQSGAYCDLAAELNPISSVVFSNKLNDLVSLVKSQLDVRRGELTTLSLAKLEDGKP